MKNRVSLETIVDQIVSIAFTFSNHVRLDYAINRELKKKEKEKKENRKIFPNKTRERCKINRNSIVKGRRESLSSKYGQRDSHFELCRAKEAKLSHCCLYARGKKEEYSTCTKQEKNPSRISGTIHIRFTCIIDCCNFIGGANVSWKDAQKATLFLQPDFSSISFTPISRCEITHRSPRNNSKYISRTTGFKFRIEQDDASNAVHERNSKSRGPHSVFSPTYTYSLRIEHIHVETTDRHPTLKRSRIEG